MGVEDMQVNSAVRSLLASFGVDGNQVYVSARSGVVSLRGKLFLRAETERPLTGATIQSMEDTMLKLKGVKKVGWQLDNWKVRGTRWVNMDEEAEEEKK